MELQKKEGLGGDERGPERLLLLQNGYGDDEASPELGPRRLGRVG